MLISVVIALPLTFLSYTQAGVLTTENPFKAKHMHTICSKTVKPILRTLMNFLGMKRVNTRGIQSANKHVMMAALCYNLKKLLKWNRKTALAKAVELDKPKNQHHLVDFYRFELVNWFLTSERFLNANMDF
jgi:hypothetical protein